MKFLSKKIYQNNQKMDVTSKRMKQKWNQTKLKMRKVMEE